MQIGFGCISNSIIQENKRKYNKNKIAQNIEFFIQFEGFFILYNDITNML